MRAMVYATQGQLDLTELPTPEVGAGDMLLAVEACGICGSDVASYLHGHYVEPGQVLGHEMSATIAGLGDSVSGLELGQRVAVRPSRSCGHCAYCLVNKTYLCSESGPRTLGYGERGGYADFVIIRDVVVGADVVPVPAELSVEETVWAEPLAVAVHAIVRAGVDRSTPLLVVGAGSVGLCVVAGAFAVGAPAIVVVEPRAERREAAAALNARAVAPGNLGNASFAAIIDTSGSSVAISEAAQHLDSGGQLALVGLGDHAVPWPLPSVEIAGSFAYTDDDFRLAVDHLTSGRVTLSRFVSHRYGLAQTGEGIAASAQDPTVIKAVIYPALDRADI